MLLSHALVLSSLSFIQQTIAAPTPQSLSISFGLQIGTGSPYPQSSLPPPTTSLKLIALGLGYQNYTCASPTASPVAMGAVAKLYDATLLLTAAGALTSSAAPGLTCAADHTNSAGVLSQVGVHYFNGLGLPNFDLYGAGMYLQATKLAAAPAPNPTDSCSIGRAGQGPVPWLKLGADASGMSKGISSVYRVNTVGGVAASCAGTTTPGQVIQSDYAAEYFFYA